MVEVTISALTPSTPPTDGWKIRYRIKGTTGAYTVPVGSPFSSLPIVFDTTDAAGTLYEVQVARDCGTLESIWFTLNTPCDCTNAGVGFSEDISEGDCKKIVTTSPTITRSDYCLAKSSHLTYSRYGSRIYKTGFIADTLFIPFGNPDTYIYGQMSISPQWANPSLSYTAGPQNRDSVWIDSDCDGNVDALSVGEKVTMAFMYNNTGASRTIYIGVAADNEFKLVVNGSIIVNTVDYSLHSGSGLQYNIWHIIPVSIKSGINYFNCVGTGDGSNVDSMSMVGYDNTAAQIKAATSDSQLSIIFRSSSLRGTSYDIATCASNYSLDTSAGQGNYICTRTLTDICNKAAP